MATINITIESAQAVESAGRISKAIYTIKNAASAANTALLSLEKTATTSFAKLSTMNRAYDQVFSGLNKSFYEAMVQFDTTLKSFRDGQVGVRSELGKTSKSLEGVSKSASTQFVSSVSQVADGTKKANKELEKTPSALKKVDTSAKGSIGSLTKFFGQLAIGVFLIGEINMIVVSLSKAFSALGKTVPGFSEITYQMEVLKSQLVNILRDILMMFDKNIIKMLEDLNHYISQHKDAIEKTIVSTLGKIKSVWETIKEMVAFFRAHEDIFEIGILGYAMFGKSGSKLLTIARLVMLERMVTLVMNLNKAKELVDKGKTTWGEIYEGSGGFTGGRDELAEFLKKRNLELKSEGFSLNKNEIISPKEQLSARIELAKIQAEKYKKILDDLQKAEDEYQAARKSRESKSDFGYGTRPELYTFGKSDGIKERQEKIIRYTELLREAADAYSDLMNQVEKPVPNIDSIAVKNAFKGIADTIGYYTDDYMNVLEKARKDQFKIDIDLLNKQPGGIENAAALELADYANGVEENLQRSAKALELYESASKSTSVMVGGHFDLIIQRTNLIYDLNVKIAKLMGRNDLVYALSLKHRIDGIDLELRKFNALVALYNKANAAIPGNEFISPNELETRIRVENLQYIKDSLAAGDDLELQQRLLMAHEVKKGEILNHNNLIWIQDLQKILELEKGIMSEMSMQALVSKKTSLESMGIYSTDVYDQIEADLRKRINSSLADYGDNADYYKYLAQLQDVHTSRFKAMMQEEEEYYEATGVYSETYFEKVMQSLEDLQKLWDTWHYDDKRQNALTVKFLMDEWDKFYNSQSAGMKKYQELTGKMPVELFRLELDNIDVLVKKLELAGVAGEMLDEISERLKNIQAIKFLEGKEDIGSGIIAGLMRVRQEIEPWGKTMSDAVVNIAHDMYNAMDDYFFEALEGRFGDMRDLLASLSQSVKKGLASLMTENVKRGVGSLLDMVLPGASDILNNEKPMSTADRRQIELLGAIAKYTAIMAGQPYIEGGGAGTTPGGLDSLISSATKQGGWLDKFFNGQGGTGGIFGEVKSWFSSGRTAGDVSVAGDWGVPNVSGSGTSLNPAAFSADSPAAGVAGGESTASSMLTSKLYSGIVSGVLTMSMGGYNIYKSSTTTSQSTGKSMASGAMQGAMYGTASGLMIGTQIGALGGPAGMAIGAIIGAAIGTALGAFGGHGQRAKLEIGAGSQVQMGRPHVNTAFGMLGIDMADQVDTDAFMPLLDSIDEITNLMAQTMDESMVASITDVLSNWSSDKIRGEMSQEDMEGLFVDYFRTIGEAWNTEFGLWIAEFDGSLESLMTGIQEHLSIMHEVHSIIDPYGTAIKDTNIRFDAMRDTLLETGGSVAELRQVEQARNITLQEMAARQQEVADAEWERHEAEMKRLAQLKQAYQEWQIGLLPSEQGQKAQWGMIQGRWGVKDAMPSGMEAKGIIDFLANLKELPDIMMAMGEDLASQFQTDVGFILEIANAFDQTVLSVQNATEAVLDNKTATEEVNVYWDELASALIATGYEGQLLTDIEAARAKQLKDLAIAEQDTFDSMQMQLGGMDSSAIQLELWAKRFGLTSSDVISNWGAIETAVKGMSLEEFTSIAKNAGMSIGELSAIILGFDASAHSASESAHSIAEATDKLYRDIEFATGSMIGIYSELEIAQKGVTDTFMGYWNSIKDTENAMEVFPLLAERYGIAMENLNKQFTSSIYSTISSLQGVSKTAQKNSSIASISVKYGLSPSDINPRDVDSLMGQIDRFGAGKQLTPEEVSWWQGMSDAGYDINQVIKDVGTLHDIFHPMQEAVNGTTGALDNMKSALEATLKSIQGAISGIDDLIWELTGGQYAPVQSLEGFQHQYSNLFDPIATSDDPNAAFGEFSSFLPGMIDFMGAFGGYKDWNSSVVSDLQGLRGTLVDREQTLNLRLEVVITQDGKSMGAAISNAVVVNASGVTDVLANALGNILSVRMNKIKK